MSNFLDKYFDYAKELCDAPRIYHRFLARFLVGAVCKNNLYSQFGVTKIFPNIWMVLIAPSTSYRKSSAMDCAIDLLCRVDEDIVMPNSFSVEALYPLFQSRPYGVFHFDEFKTILDEFQKTYMAGAEMFLTSLYGCPPRLKRELRKEKFFFEYPCPSLLAGTTIGSLINSVTEQDIESGNLPRHLLVPAYKREEWFMPRDQDMIKTNNLVKELNDIRACIGIEYKKQNHLESDAPEPAQKFTKMSWAPEAWTAYGRWAKDFENRSYPPLIAPFFGRLCTYAIKLAMIEAVSAYEFEIRANHLDQSLEMVEVAAKAVMELSEKHFNFSDYAKDKQRVLVTISSKPAGISRSTLLNGTHIPAHILKSIMSQLLESGNVVEDERVNPLNNRKTLYYVRNENRLGAMALPPAPARVSQA